MLSRRIIPCLDVTAGRVVTQWIEDYADAAAMHLTEAEIKSKGKQRPEFRRMAADVAIQVGLGRFFGAKFRAGVLYAIYEQSGDCTALELSLQCTKKHGVTGLNLLNVRVKFISRTLQ